MSEKKVDDYPDLERDSLDSGSVSQSSDAERIIGAQIVQESGHEIQYRTCSWQKVRLPHLSRGFRFSRLRVS